MSTLAEAIRKERERTSQHLADWREFVMQTVDAIVRDKIAQLEQELRGKTGQAIEQAIEQATRDVISDFKKRINKNEKTVTDFLIHSQTQFSTELARVRDVIADSKKRTDEDEKAVTNFLVYSQTQLSTELARVRAVKIGPKGNRGDPGPRGEPGKEGSPDTPKEITSKLNTLTEAVEMSVIKGLKAQFATMVRMVRERVERKPSRGMGEPQHETFSISAGTTSVTTAYPIAASGNAIFKAAYQGQELDKDVHFTIASNRQVITFATGVQAQFQDGTTFSVTYLRG